MKESSKGGQAPSQPVSAILTLMSAPFQSAVEHEDVHPLPALGGDVRVDRDDLSPRVLLDYGFEVGRPASRTCCRMALMSLRPS